MTIRQAPLLIDFFPLDDGPYDPPPETWTTHPEWGSKVTNNELQMHWHAQHWPKWNPFTVADGALTITTMPTPEHLAEVGMPYVSGWLMGKSTDPDMPGVRRAGGYWEIEARLPLARGVWPAIWLLTVDPDGWPEGKPVKDEIDIMEGVRDVLDGVFHASVHASLPHEAQVSDSNAIRTEADLTGDFHRYGFGFSEDAATIFWTFDGRVVLERPNPFEAPLEERYLILSQAVGGWGGAPEPEDYPARFQIRKIQWRPVYKITASEPPESPVMKRAANDDRAGLTAVIARLAASIDRLAASVEELRGAVDADEVVSDPRTASIDDLTDSLGRLTR